MYFLIFDLITELYWETPALSLSERSFCLFVKVYCTNIHTVTQMNRVPHDVQCRCRSASESKSQMMVWCGVDASVVIGEEMLL